MDKQLFLMRTCIVLSLIQIFSVFGSDQNPRQPRPSSQSKNPAQHSQASFEPCKRLVPIAGCQPKEDVECDCSLHKNEKPSYQPPDGGRC